MQEQRLTQRLLRYWDMIRRDRSLPEIQHFNAQSVEDVWDQCFRVSISQRNGLSYTYEYMGKPVINLYGGDMTGEEVDEKMRQFPGSPLHKRMRDVINERKPLQDEGHIVNSKSGKILKYRACLLPFGNDGKGITHMVVGLSYREF